MNEHTPGPWTYDEHIGDIQDQHGYTIAVVHPRNRRANAVLIMRAVNAHDDLLMMLKAVHPTHPCTPIPCGACAAIRKAESE